MNDAPKKTGWIKLVRSEKTRELLAKDPLAFALLANIAMRARWREGFDADGLKPGEALLGDYTKMAMTRREYRTRLDRLTRWKFLTTRATNRGTIVTLIDADVFDIFGLNDDQPEDQQPTIKRPTDDQQPTIKRPLTKTGKKEIRGNREDNSETSSPTTTFLPSSAKANSGQEKTGVVLTPGEIWFRTCRALGRSMEQPRSDSEDGALLRCHTWMTDADMRDLEAEEQRRKVNPRHRSMTAFTFLQHAAARLRRLRGEPAEPSARSPQAYEPPAVDESDEAATDRPLSADEIWRRACRLVGQPYEPPTVQGQALLKDLEGIREWMLRLLERYTAHLKRLPGFQGKRSALALLKDFDEQVSFAETWDEDAKAERDRNRLAQGQLRAAHASAQPVVQSASAQATADPQYQRPTVDEVFAFISPAGWKLEVAQTYINNRTRTDPPWHLPATHDRPARLIGPDWHRDVNLFLKNYKEREAKKRAEAERDGFDLPF